MENRREFIQKTALATGSLISGVSAKSYGRILGSNDRIRMAIQGLGRRVWAYYPILQIGAQNVELSFLCDVKKSQIDRAKENLKDKINYKYKSTDDIRQVLEDKDTDVIFNAAPDHWHAPGACMAMEAGKHVYVEKPCSHNPAEGEALVRYMRKYNKKVQMGNQQRSDKKSREIINDIHNGLIGKVYKALAFYSNNRGRVPNPVKADPPKDLNWELFQGPAPREEYRHDTWNYNWHWYGWKWGTAESGNNATHEIDLARWALQVDYPNQVITQGDKQHFEDDGWEMYDTMYATFKYKDNKTIIWDGQSRNSYKTYGADRGTIVYGTEGSVFMNRNEWIRYDRSGKKVADSTEKSNEVGTALGGGGDMSTAHIINFFDAIRGKDTLHAPIDDGAISSYLCHLINISWRTGQSLEVNPENGKFLDQNAMKYWGRDYEPGWEI